MMHQQLRPSPEQIEPSAHKAETQNASLLSPITDNSTWRSITNAYNDTVDYVSSWIYPDTKIVEPEMTPEEIKDLEDKLDKIFEAHRQELAKNPPPPPAEKGEKVEKAEKAEEPPKKHPVEEYKMPKPYCYGELQFTILC